jgi:hypothetical protein
VWSKQKEMCTRNQRNDEGDGSFFSSHW